MRDMKLSKRLLSAGLTVALAGGMLPAAVGYGDAYAATTLSDEEFERIISTYSLDDSILPYKEYVASHESVHPSAEVVVGAAEISRYENETGESEAELLAGFEGFGGTAIMTGEQDIIEFDFTVSESGFYTPVLTYYPVEGKSSEIQRAFFLDGALPYEEMSLIEINRIWTTDVSEKYKDANGITVKAWETDNQGFQVKPEAIEAPEWVLAPLYDSNGYITDPLEIYLTAGSHTLSIVSQKEPMAIGNITFTQVSRLMDYADYKSSYDNNGAIVTRGVNVRVEAENTDKMSSQMLYPRQDQSSPYVYPSSPKLLFNNVVGGTSWQEAGQWIEWNFEVPEDGYYDMSFFAKQNYVRGIDVCRKIYIDGEVPFTEMSDYGFAYHQSWWMETVSDDDGNPYSFYLSAGSHVLKMEVVLGDMADIIARVQASVQDLNSIYRQIIYITGVAPDVDRDYQIEASLPGLTAEIQEVYDEISDIIEQLKITAGNNSDKLTVLITMRDQLKELIKDNERFTEVISSYKTNVRACGNWITQMLPQPLAIDRIVIHSSDVVPEGTEGGFFDGIGYELQRLYYSFVIDYNQIGNVAEDTKDSVTLTLWVGTGRDQANVVKALIDENFTNNTGINVNVQLVDMNTLLRATLAGEGPDMAIQVANTNGIAGAVLNTGNDTPVNYGLRHAVLDLSQFSGYDEVASRFAESAIVPFSFNGATYALPETETFPMMFYRKDILAEIGLDIPRTWDEVKVAMTVLAKNQMEFGMLPTEQIFAMLLFQNGGEYYTENGDRSMLDSDIAVKVFKEYCEFYTDYKLDKATSVEERFRTGECPIIISDYTTYNNLQVSAPDIAGLWDFTVVPGIEQEDGTINHTTGATGLADIIMANTRHPDEAWEFLKWWTSAETQTLYGREMESLMGASARVATANLEALANLSWPIKDYNELIEQLEQGKGIPQVPGGYYTWRNVNNAFYSVTTDASSTGRSYVATPREELMDKVLYINAEIDYKRIEFELPLSSGN